MTVKFHITNKGVPGRCSAKAGNCPYGSQEEHYGTKEEAQAAFEKSMGDFTFPASVKDQRVIAADLKSPQKALLHLAQTSKDQKTLENLVSNPMFPVSGHAALAEGNINRLVLLLAAGLWIG